MALVSRWVPRPLSQRAFERQVRGLLDRAAVEDLASRLEASGPISIRDTKYNAAADRVRLECADGGVLTLRLFWPRRGAVATLDSLRFDHRIGWIATAQSSGSPVVFYAWLATYATKGAAEAKLRRPARERGWLSPH